jgi:hypothetical protein
MRCQFPPVTYALSVSVYCKLSFVPSPVNIGSVSSALFVPSSNDRTCSQWRCLISTASVSSALTKNMRAYIHAIIHAHLGFCQISVHLSWHIAWRMIKNTFQNIIWTMKIRIKNDRLDMSMEIKWGDTPFASQSFHNDFVFCQCHSSCVNKDQREHVHIY